MPRTTEAPDRVAAAIEARDEAAVRELLAREPGVASARDGQGRSLLLLALFHGLDGAAAAQAHRRRSSSASAVSRSCASVCANGSRSPATTCGAESSARSPRRSSSSGASAPKLTRPRAGVPSAAAETSSDRPV